MKNVIVFGIKKDSERAANSIEQVLARLDFEPECALFYSTLGYNSKYRSMQGILEEHSEMICITSPETSCITNCIEGCFT